MEILFASLSPVDKANLEFTASMLNPEAGNHAVPDNVGELQAAVIAAEKCRGEFPYFNERYQERGGNFAKSELTLPSKDFTVSSKHISVVRHI